MAPRLRLTLWLSGLAVVVIGMTLAWVHQATTPAPLFTTAQAAAVPPLEGRIAVPATPANTGAHAIRSVLDVGHPMTFGDFVWNDHGVPAGPVWVQVDLSHQLISVFRAGHEIGTAVILYGGNGKPTPSGDFPVLQKALDYQSKTYDAPMPYMLRLTADGVAIHASNVRPGWATHGCIGVPPEFARKLFAEVKLGDRVVVTNG